LSIDEAALNPFLWASQKNASLCERQNGEVLLPRGLSGYELAGDKERDL
jgi:hypothetical protein